MAHQDNFGTNLTSNQIAGVTTTPLNSIPSVDAPFYITLDAENTNGHFEVVYVTSKTATNINHAATTYAHTTAEVVTMDIVSAEVDGFQSGWNPLPGTWSATDANTISIASLDLTGSFQLGDKIKVTNNSAVKYFYISTAPAFSTNTTFDVSGEVDLVAGAITLPYYSKMDSPQGFKDGKIWYKARAYRGATQNRASSDVKVILDTESYDPNSNFDNATNFRYSVPVSGYYHIVAKAVNLAASPMRIVPIIYKNGAALSFGSSVYSSQYSGGMVEDVQYLSKGDYVEFYVYADASCDMQGGAGSLYMAIQFISI